MPYMIAVSLEMSDEPKLYIKSSRKHVPTHSIFCRMFSEFLRIIKESDHLGFCHIQLFRYHNAFLGLMSHLFPEIRLLKVNFKTIKKKGRAMTLSPTLSAFFASS